MTIFTCDGHEPHASHGGWANYLATCSVRGASNLAIWYSVANCHYILLPTGLLVELFGYHAHAMWDRIHGEC